MLLRVSWNFQELTVGDDDRATYEGINSRFRLRGGTITHTDSSVPESKPPTVDFGVLGAFTPPKMENRAPIYKESPNFVIKERKGKERKRTCIAPIVSISTTKRSDVYHTELPANTPHLPFLRISIR